jgi:ATP-binding cassette subfamily A (ABC1) protein 3
MLKEKEKKITENMRNMGMSLLPHYLAWFSFYLLVLFVCSIIWTFLVKVTFFAASNVILIWLLYFLTGVVLLTVSFIVCSFFVSAKPGVLFGIITFFLFYGVTILTTTVESPTESIYNGFALSPFTSLSFAARSSVLLESLNKYGIHFEHIGITIDNFKYRTFIIITILESIIFFFIGIYLDQVWPTEIGIKKHPLFFLGVSFKNKVQDSSQNQEAYEAHIKDYYEPLTQDLIEKKKDVHNMIQITNLRKVYNNGKVAVHNLNLEMFDNQIFALLGHNGAGKTTTISMISGLLTQSSGSISICGFDTKTHYDDIKKLLGVCPQLNPIYDNLTCYDHLLLYGNLKTDGRSKLTEAEIDQILTDIDLIDKKNFPAGRLSGGQKRKLCIGIAFIGGSKVILLDEPTSGMDTYARRFLWEMIKKYKKDRIIILCTHYMDEADFLGDRFGIMGEGKLITCGSSLFLKKKFGVGYDLTIVKQNSQTSSDHIEALVKRMVPHSEKTGDISMEIKFRLPTDQSSHFEALFAELESKKDKYGVQSFGISLTTLEEVFLKVAVGFENNNAGHEKEKEINNFEDDLDFELEHIREKNPNALFRMHFAALCTKRFIYFKRDLKGVFCELILPIIIITLGLCITLIRFVRDPTPKDLVPTNFLPKEAQGWIAYPTSMTPSIVNDLKGSFQTNAGFRFAKDLTVDTLKGFEDELVNQRVNERYWAFYLNQIDNVNKVYQYTVFFNTTISPAASFATNMMNTAILRQATGDQNAKIKVGVVGLLLTKQLASFNNTAIGFISVFLFALAYAFIPAGVILFIVKEREHNSKHQQIVSGVSVYAYWLSNLLIDLCKYMIPGIYCALSILIFNVEAFTERDNYGAVWALVMLYGPAMLTFTYLTSFMFKSPESAQIATFIFNFLAGLIFMILSFALRAIKSTRKTAPYFPELLLRLIPTYDFSWGLFQLTNSQIWQIFYDLDQKPGAWSRWGAVIDVIYLIFIPFICLGLIFWIELGTSKESKSQNLDGATLLDLEIKDEDVKREREEVTKNEDYAIRVVDFAKQYTMLSKQGGCCSTQLLQKKVAVKGVTFGVRKGDCFGLLGTNGAGKTTTFKALSGEIIPSFGVTQIAGLDLRKNMSKVRYLIGYCPQFETLLDNLTSREHLELYAAIKGIPYNLRERIIKDKLVQLNLSKFEHVQAGTYSGGNKRKLSVAIALLGNPPIVLLDEPSSGMDPEARRFMWSVVGKISSEKKHSSVVLTTHSMEEAEALSTKLAIMVEGKIECIGPVQSLKNKYGKGFEIEAKIAQPTPAELEKMKQDLGFTENTDIPQEMIGQIFEKYSLTDLVPQITATGRLSSLYQQVSLAKPDRLHWQSLPGAPLRARPAAGQGQSSRAIPQAPFPELPAHRKCE